jgi:hypothetical protein
MRISVEDVRHETFILFYFIFRDDQREASHPVYKELSCRALAEALTSNVTCLSTVTTFSVCRYVISQYMFMKLRI